MGRLRIYTAIACTLFISLLYGQNISIDHAFWQTDGKVNTIVEDTINQIIYVGGDFEEFRQGTPYGAVIDFENAMVRSNMPVPNGEVICAIEDEFGGWYIGGEFSQVNNQERKGIAYITPEGEIGPFNANINGTVRTIAIYQDRLFFAGSFSEVAGLERDNIAAVDIQSASPLDWHVRLNNQNGTLSSPTKIKVIDDKLMVLGGFRKINGQGDFGVLVSMNDPDFNYFADNPNDDVEMVVPDGNGGWVILGEFTLVGDSIRNRIAHLNQFGEVTALNLQITSDISLLINDIKVKDNILYIGGRFDKINGKSRDNIAAVNLLNHAILPWNPRLNEQVKSFDIVDSTLFVNGSFDRIGYWGTHGISFYTADMDYRNIKCFPNGDVEVCIPDGNGGWIISGQFGRICGEIRDGIAHIDQFGETLDFDITYTGHIKDMALFGDSLLIVGDISSVNSQSRDNISLVNLYTSELYDWNPGSDLPVNDIDTQDGIDVYFVGDFNQIDGQLRKRAAAFNISTGEILSWQPKIKEHVETIKITGDEAYLGGTFSLIGNYAENGVPTDITSGNPQTGFPETVGDINIVISDDEGGWYIGGNFSSVGELERNNIAQIDANGDVTDFAPIIYGEVNCLILDNDLLYIAGDVYSINGEIRTSIGAIDVANNTLDSWTSSVNFSEITAIHIHGQNIFVGGINGTIDNPPIPLQNFVALDTESGAYDPNWLHDMNSVTDMLIHEDHLYVAGPFSSIDGADRKGLARFNLNTGNLSPWNAEISGYVPPYGNVYAIEKIDNTLYVGGGFTQAAGTFQPNLVAFNLATETPTLTDWSLSLGLDETIFQLHAYNEMLYLTGNFETIVGETRNGIAAINPINQTASDWEPNKTGGIRTIVGANNKIFIGGEALLIGGQNRSSIARVSILTGLVDDWAPIVTRGPGIGHIYDLEIVNNHIFIGGDFDEINNTPSGNLARLSSESNEPTLSNLNVDNDVICIEAMGDNLYFGGIFQNVSGYARSSIAAIDVESGVLQSWNPTNPGFGGVETISVQNNQIYFGGGFEALGGHAFDNVGAIKLSTGEAEVWPFVQNGSMQAIRKVDNNLLVSGNFSEVNGVSRNKIAIVSPITGEPTEFNPNINFYSSWPYITDFVAIDNNLYLVGDFDQIDDQPRNQLACIKINTGGLIDWYPEINGTVMALSKYNSDIILGGNINTINGAERKNIGAVDANSGETQEWSLPVDYASILSIEIVDSALYLGGSFEKAGGIARRTLAAFNAETLELENWDLNIEAGGIADFEVYDGILYTTATFITINGVEKELIAAFNFETAELLDFTANGTGNGSNIEIVSSGIYINGNLNVPGIESDHLASFDFNGNVRDWDPESEADVYDMKVMGDGVVFCGGNSIDFPDYKFLVKVDTISGQEISNWNPNPNYSVRSISTGQSDIYIGGTFGSINPQIRESIAAFDSNTGALLDFDVSIEGEVQDLAIHNGMLYIAGNLESLNGSQRFALASVEISSGIPTTLNPNANVTIYDLLVHGDTLFIGGYFQNIGSSGSEKLAAMNLNTHEFFDFDFDFDASGSSIFYGVRSMDIANNKLYIGGDFDSVEGFEKRGLAAIDLSTNSVTEWQSSFNSTYNSARAVFVNQNKLYLGGSFRDDDQNLASQLIYNLEDEVELEFAQSLSTTLNCIGAKDDGIFLGTYGPTSVNNSSLISQDATTNEFHNWNPNTINQVNSLLVSGNKLFAGGEFYSVGGYQIKGFVAINLPDCSGDATCNDISFTLDTDGTGQLDTTNVVFDLSFGDACNWTATSLSQSYFDCNDIGNNSISATIISDLNIENTCEFNVNVLANIAIDLDFDGIGDACDLCFGDNASGDSDGDGICNDSEIIGCQDEDACDFNPEATEMGACAVFPEPNCTTCDPTPISIELILIDDDGDGICNSQEVYGCQDPLAINYNPNATDYGPCQYGFAGGQGISLNPTAEIDGGRPANTNTFETANHSLNPDPSTHWDFTPFPNPWDGNAQLQIQITKVNPSHHLPTQFTLHVYDITGREIYTQKIINQDNKTLFTLTTPRQFENGTYLISITDQNYFRQTQTLVINK